MLAKHLGYLHAKPSDWPKTGPQSRYEMHVTRKGRPPPLPSVGDAAYLFEAWVDLGRVLIFPSMGFTALSFTEIASGKPWTNEAERGVIRKMSEAYCAGLDLGKDVLAIAPWSLDD